MSLDFSCSPLHFSLALVICCQLEKRKRPFELPAHFCSWQEGKKVQSPLLYCNFCYKECAMKEKKCNSEIFTKLWNKAKLKNMCTSPNSTVKIKNMKKSLI
jgi:hypothetical protein